MAPAEPLPTCRRKALIAAGISLSVLALVWAGYAQAWPLSHRLLGGLASLGLGGLLAAVFLWFTPDMSDAVSKKLMARYYREMWPAMGAYVLVMLGWKRLLGLVEATWLRVLVALLPALLVLWVMRAFVRYVRDSDELQRRIELESGAVAALLVSAGYLGAGFLQTAELIAIPAKVAMLWVFPLLCLFYGIVRTINGRRYL
jgi:hypothetical protein